ncbi:MAG: hypothetical protein DHS20C17_07870 [Cyclobacteriaceae bacterium]|nr:MAG: hypothetical protein DHS20C17_07870 [Cyclobacteriaceae bacterium]
MKAILRLSIALALLTTMPSSIAWSQGVHYDFDSLLQHNSQFESLASIVFDTFKIFGPEQPLEFTVSTDLRALAKNKYDDEYQTADVIFNLWDTINISREIRIKPRGEFRLKNCSNPPLRVNVKKTEEVFQLLDGLSKLKMVVPCKGASSYQHYILNEYMAYKLYNIITENSFLVRLIKVHYYDTGGKVKEGEAYTFIIESEKAMAKRLGSIPIDNEKINARYLDPETAAVLYLYQFMIGNTDWSVPGLHNMKLIKTSNVTRPNPIPVTYDLDYSGFVNASYAIPGDHVSIKEVTEREYMGYCLPPEHMEKAFDLFIQKEPQIIAAVEKFSLISDRQKKICLNFLDEFFEIIKNPRSRENRIIARCKK